MLLIVFFSFVYLCQCIFVYTIGAYKNAKYNNVTINYITQLSVEYLLRTTANWFPIVELVPRLSTGNIRDGSRIVYR